MVAKPYDADSNYPICLNLAKIHMVAKLEILSHFIKSRLNLAKIHMVAKLLFLYCLIQFCLNLAKIHMVAKPPAAQLKA